MITWNLFYVWGPLVSSYDCLIHFRIEISNFLSGYSQCINNAFYYVGSVFFYRSPTVSVPSGVCLSYPKMAVGVVDTRV